MGKKKTSALESWIIGVVVYSVSIVLIVSFIDYAIAFVTNELGNIPLPFEYLVGIALFLGATLQHFCPLDSDKSK